MNGSARSRDGAASSESGGTEAKRPWKPAPRPTAGEPPEDSEPWSLYETLRQLVARIRWIIGLGVMRASVPLRTLSGEPIRARAWLKSARIEEWYKYSQEVSLNADIHELEEPAGLIKLTLPYDGEKYFTRQAYQDVVGARRGGAGPTGEAVIGFLALTSYEATGLEEPLGLQANYGSIPIRVALPASPAGPGEAEQIFAGDKACVVSQKYQPVSPKLVPVKLDIELDDPDTAESRDETPPRRRQRAADALDLSAVQADRAEVIGRSPERQLDFVPDLWLRLTVRLYLPRKLAEGAIAKVSKVFISWPTHTSLSSLTLRADGMPQIGYNPEQEHEGCKGGLEWSGVPLEPEEERPAAREARDDGGSDDAITTLSSAEMVLTISNPGDLYKQDKLSGRIEVTVNRLLSGMEARLYDSTGRQCQPQRPKLELQSTFTVDFSLPLYDAFARRIMSPYQWLYFDEVIPSEMRIDDIKMALRNRGFRSIVLDGPNPENCCIIADRVHGPDQLRLALYVKGERYKARRERSVPGGMTYRTSVDSGDMRLYVYGFLRSDSKPVVREINALRRALRERFDRLPAGR